MIRHLSPRERKIFTACLLVVGAALVYNGFYVPLQEKILALDEAIPVKARELGVAKRTIGKAKQFSERYARYIERYGQKGTDASIVSSYLSDIEAVAGRINVPIAELKPNKIEKHELHSRFTVQVSFKCELVELVHFLHVVQQAPYGFDVERADFQKAVGRQGDEVSARLVLGKIFIQAEETALDKGTDEGKGT